MKQKTTFYVHLKDSELGKINLDDTHKFSTLEEAKAYCERCFRGLGNARFTVVPPIYDEEYIEFTRELAACDYLGIIEPIKSIVK